MSSSKQRGKDPIKNICGLLPLVYTVRKYYFQFIFIPYFVIIYAFNVLSRDLMRYLYRDTVYHDTQLLQWNVIISYSCVCHTNPKVLAMHRTGNYLHQIVIGQVCQMYGIILPGPNLINIKITCYYYSYFPHSQVLSWWQQFTCVLLIILMFWCWDLRTHRFFSHAKCSKLTFLVEFSCDSTVNCHVKIQICLNQIYMCFSLTLK